MPEKLIRDNMPEICKQPGHWPLNNVRIATAAEYPDFVRRKVVEEANEVLTAVGIGAITEELGDLLDVIDVLVDAYGVDLRQLADVRMAKTARLGKFYKRNIWLIEDKPK